MAVYDFQCSADHVFEIRCSISEREKAHPCPTCGAESKQVILTFPNVNDPTKVVLDYPGSKRLKAGYAYSHGPKPAQRVQSGYGGMVSPERKHHDPLADNITPERVSYPKKSL